MSEQAVIEREDAPDDRRGTAIMQAAEAGDPMMRMVAAAMSDSAVDVGKLERLMDMRDREMARVGREEYMRAMTAAQSEMRNIRQDARNDQTSSNYAKLDGIIKAIRPIYTSHGLSLSFGTEDCPLDGHMRVVCNVMHTGGHCERMHMDIPIDIAGIKGNQNKTATHAHGSTMSYARRYLTLLIFNLATGDDDDGNAADQLLPDEYAAELKQMLHDTEADVARFLKALSARTKVQIGSVDDIPAAHYLTAKTMIENNAKRKQSGE